jgi:hypothetical protein
MDAIAELVQMDRLVVHLLIEAKERPALLDLRASLLRRVAELLRR